MTCQLLHTVGPVFIFEPNFERINTQNSSTKSKNKF